MEALLTVIREHPFGKACVAPFSKEDQEIRQLRRSGSGEADTLWGGHVRSLAPPRLTTAWLLGEDPLMALAGSGYRNTEVRDKTFALQEEAAQQLRGNRRLPKAKVADALAALKPTVDQTKIVAAVLYALRQIQTVCFDEAGKTLWTVPEDLRVWSRSRRTLWVDARCERMLEWQDTDAAPPPFGLWLSQREAEGWTIPWPEAEDTFEELKEKMRGQPGEPKGKGFKKVDWARALGRLEAIEHLALLERDREEAVSL
jgi:hypothetical protein